MFDKLDDLLIRFEEVLNELGEPDVTSNPDRFQKLMKEQSDLQPIVDTYKEYKKNKETIQDSLSMLEEEKDEDMREMLKEELSDAKKRVEELEHELKILLLPHHQPLFLRHHQLHHQCTLLRQSLSVLLRRLWHPVLP